MPTTPESKTTAKPTEPVAEKSNRASDYLKYRNDQIGAKQAAEAANADVRKVAEEALKNATPVQDAAFVGTHMNQVPQEGALVETPPQPLPPNYTTAELKEMDHAPRGMREPSVAAGASGAEDFDQTVHPEARVNDPRFPL